MNDFLVASAIKKIIVIKVKVLILLQINVMHQ